MKKKIVMIDGGIGRTICAIPAINELAKKENITVVATWLEPFFNNKNLKRTYHVGQPYIWEDIIKQGILIHPEPYEDHEYYNQEMHLIQAFYKDLGLEPPKELPKIELPLQDVEIKMARESLKNLKEKHKKDKVIIFQPFGASMNTCSTTCKNPTEEDYEDISNRSLKFSTTLKIIEELKKYAVVIVMASINCSTLKNIEGVEIPQLQLRNWFSLIKEADYVIGCDSVAQHITYAYDKPGFFVYGGTYIENVGYPILKHFVKEGYPKEYNPMRIPSNAMQMVPVFNEGAMGFSEEEEQKLIDELLKFIEVENVQPKIETKIE